jgi:hypothetical protein
MSLTFTYFYDFQMTQSLVTAQDEEVFFKVQCTYVHMYYVGLKTDKKANVKLVGKF